MKIRQKTEIYGKKEEVRIEKYFHRAQARQGKESKKKRKEEVGEQSLHTEKS